jgi:recombination protein RecA
MGLSSLEQLPLVRASSLLEGRVVGAGGDGEGAGLHLSRLAGRLVELPQSAGSTALTLAGRLLLEAQLHQEPVAWIARRDSIFYPPDMAAAGVDLAALPVVWAPGAAAAVQAAEHLLRSRAFGLLILDLDAGERVQQGRLGRLAKLAEGAATALVFLTSTGTTRADAIIEAAGSLGSVVSLRARTRLESLGRGRFRCAIQVTKDKWGGPGARYQEPCRGPEGLR